MRDSCRISEQGETLHGGGGSPPALRKASVLERLIHNSLVIKVYTAVLFGNIDNCSEERSFDAENNVAEDTGILQDQNSLWQYSLHHKL